MFFFLLVAVLSNINQLITAIKEGDANKAGKLAGELADRRVPLQSKDGGIDSSQDAIP